MVAALVADGGADGDVLDRSRGPVVPADGQPHADDGVGADELRLLLESRERAQARGVPRLRDDRQLRRDPAHLHAEGSGPLLPADVIDRASHHLRARTQPDRVHERELAHRQVGGEEAAAGLADLAETLLGAQRQLATLERRERSGLLHSRGLTRCAALVAAAAEQRHGR